MPVLVSAYFRARRADGTHPRSAAACAISPDPRRFAGHRRGRDGRRARPHRPSCRKTTTIRGRNELLACRSASRFYSADGRSTVGDATRVTRVTLSRVDHQRQRLARPAEPRNDRHDDIPRPRIVRASTVVQVLGDSARASMGGLEEPGFCGLCALSIIMEVRRC